MSQGKIIMICGGIVIAAAVVGSQLGGNGNVAESMIDLANSATENIAKQLAKAVDAGQEVADVDDAGDDEVADDEAEDSEPVADSGGAAGSEEETVAPGEWNPGELGGAPGK